MQQDISKSRIIFENKCLTQPLVSIVLIDWSVRDSYHILDYLANQTIPRDKYEVLWIEYFDRRPPELEQHIKKCTDHSLPPPIDKWIVLEMPKDVYYHKHLLYNAGIIASSGRIVTFCDSDAMVRPTFVESIVKKFEEDSNIVLHEDRFQNYSKRFYPFNYPPFEEVTGEGCTNCVAGNPRGLVDNSDPLHLRNYGACMSALREDLVAIGGADEHKDYLGYICGPYEMTFRLLNAGKKELWHESEWVYHVWHPGQAGDSNYFGPHDGKHMSTTALDIRVNGRVMPLVENPAIQMLRQKGTANRDILFSFIISDSRIKEWSKKEETKNTKKYDIGNVIITARQLNGFKEDNENGLGYKGISALDYLWATFSLNRALLRMCTKSIYERTRCDSALLVPVTMHLGILKLFNHAWEYIQRTLQYNRYIVIQCQRCLNRLASRGVKEVAVYGTGDVVILLCILSKLDSMKVSAVYDDVTEEKGLYGHRVLPLEALNGCKEKIIISDILNVGDKIDRLNRLGIERDRIVRIL